MNKEWSELNKAMQTQIGKKDTYEVGINEYALHIRELLISQLDFLDGEVQKFVPTN